MVRDPDDKSGSPSASYETVDVRLKLVWRRWETLESLPKTKPERKKVFSKYPMGRALYRLRFSDGAQRLWSYIGETEKGFGGSGGRLDMHTRTESKGLKLQDLQREMQAALASRRVVTIDHLCPEESKIEILQQTVGRAVRLENADERLMLEALLGLAEREIGRTTLNSPKKNRSQRGKHARSKKAV